MCLKNLCGVKKTRGFFQTLTPYPAGFFTPRNVSRPAPRGFFYPASMCWPRTPRGFLSRVNLLTPYPAGFFTPYPRGVFRSFIYAAVYPVSTRLFYLVSLRGLYKACVLNVKKTIFVYFVSRRSLRLEVVVLNVNALTSWLGTVTFQPWDSDAKMSVKRPGGGETCEKRQKIAKKNVFFSIFEKKYVGNVAFYFKLSS